jgi:hypothetical protein
MWVATLIASLGVLAACDDGSSVGKDGLTREDVVDFLNAQIEASEELDVEQLSEYMAESVYMRGTATFDGAGIAPEVTECVSREECVGVLERELAAVSDYEVSVSDVEVSVAPDRRSATVRYTQHESGVILGTRFEAEAAATDEYEVEGRDLVITRSEADAEVSLEL